MGERQIQRKAKKKKIDSKNVTWTKENKLLREREREREREIPRLLIRNPEMKINI